MKALGCFLAAWLIVVAFTALGGCRTATPPGYDSDTTPGHDGSNWIGQVRR